MTANKLSSNTYWVVNNKNLSCLSEALGRRLWIFTKLNMLHWNGIIKWSPSFPSLKKCDLHQSLYCCPLIVSPKISTTKLETDLGTLAENIDHAKLPSTWSPCYPNIQNLRIWLRSSWVLLCWILNNWRCNSTMRLCWDSFQGALESKGTRKAVVSGSCISLLHRQDFCTKVNCVTAILESMQSHWLFMNIGQRKICCESGYISLTSHVCSKAIFSSAFKGHPSQLLCGFVSTL